MGTFTDLHQFIISFFQFAAAVCCGLTVTALMLLFFDVIRNIQVEKKVTNEEEYRRIPIVFRLFMPLVPNMMPIVRSESMQTTVQKAEERLAMCGYDTAMTGEQFVAVRLLMTIFGCLLLVLFLVGGEIMNGVLLLLCLVFYPNAWLKTLVAKRHLEILKALPNVLDLLTLSVEAGRGFLTALRDIVGRRQRDALNDELRRTLHEIQLGKSRQAALKEMAQRVRQPELTTVLNSIIQADELGVSIGQLLRVQGDQLRAKRFSFAEKLANEAPVKILFPIVVFIFPCVFLVLMGPLVMQALKSFSS